MRKSVFVTGATNGTGFAIAERFAREGYDVFIGSRNEENSISSAKKIADKYGVFAKGYKTEIFNEENVKSIFSDIKEMGYLLDVLVLNAANLGIGQESLTVDIEEFMNVYNTNVGWNFMMAREACKHMMEKKKGSIVFITSNSALRVTGNRCAYCSSKSAILAMSKSFAYDWGKYGVRSNCVLPVGKITLITLNIALQTTRLLKISPNLPILLTLLGILVVTNLATPRALNSLLTGVC